MASFVEHDHRSCQCLLHIDQLVAHLFIWHASPSDWIAIVAITQSSDFESKQLEQTRAMHAVRQRIFKLH